MLLGQVKPEREDSVGGITQQRTVSSGYAAAALRFSRYGGSNNHVPAVQVIAGTSRLSPLLHLVRKPENNGQLKETIDQIVSRKIC